MNNICDGPKLSTMVNFFNGGGGIHALIFMCLTIVFHHYILHCYLVQTFWSSLIVKIFLRKEGISVGKVNLSQ